MKNNISINEIIDLITEKINNEGEVYLKVTGNSMYPFLKNRRDQVCLIKAPEKLSKGDIVLFNNHGIWTLHRIVCIKNNNIILCGDALKSYEYTVKNNIVAIVSKIITPKKEIDVKSKWYKFKVKLWRFFFPLRRYLLRIIRKFDKNLKSR